MWTGYNARQDLSKDEGQTLDTSKDRNASRRICRPPPVLSDPLYSSSRPNESHRRQRENAGGLDWMSMPSETRDFSMAFFLNKTGCLLHIFEIGFSQTYVGQPMEQ